MRTTTAMARPLNSGLVMRGISILLFALLLACRGEPVPRDYQNAPPAMTHPPQTQSESPGAHGMGKGTPEPTTGVEGTAGPYEPATATAPTATNVSDTPPVTTTKP